MFNWLKNFFKSSNKSDATGIQINNDEISATANPVPAEFVVEVVNNVKSAPAAKKAPTKKPAAKKAPTKKPKSS